MSRRNKRKKLIVRVAVLAAVIFVMLLTAIVFQVRTVSVFGNTCHSSEEIISDLTEGAFGKNTLYILWKCKKGAVPDEMPYLRSLEVKMKSPFKLEVIVEEKEPIACIEQQDSVYFDKEGTVLSLGDAQNIQVPLVTGVNAEEAVLYQKLPTESSAQLRTILSLTQLLRDHELQAEEIRFSENMEVTVYVQGVEAQMGQDEYLEEKVANLNKILPRLEGQSGVLHLESFTGRNETVSFTPSGSDEELTNIGGSIGQQSEENQTGGTDGDPESLAGMEADGEEGPVSEGEADSDSSAGENPDEAPEGQEDGGNEGTVYPMVFDSSGTLIYNVHVENGVVVDQYGTPVSGCSVNENGNVVDAYWNEFDSQTGELIQ